MGALKTLYWRFVHPQLQHLGGISTPADKVRLIRAHAEKDGTLIETGTYLGDTTAACAPSFRRVYTIELDPALAERARQRFEGTNVTVLEGDSAEVLRTLVPQVERPAVFWLDAHFCGEHTANSPLPLLEELEIIQRHGAPDVVLIDDAHHMGVAATRFQDWVRAHCLDMIPTWPNTPTVEDISRFGEISLARDVIQLRLTGAARN